MDDNTATTSSSAPIGRPALDELYGRLRALPVPDAWELLSRLCDGVPSNPLAGVRGEIESLYASVAGLPAEARTALLLRLRADIPSHPLEEQWGVSAETLIVALSHAGPLTRRMIPGVIAEHAFRRSVIPALPPVWEDRTPRDLTEIPYDFLVHDGTSDVKVQVKLQRSEGGRPARVSGRNQSGLTPGMYYVETDKSRGGTDRRGQETRGYMRKSFDILAVSMRPSTGRWDSFLYTVERWLLLRRDNLWLAKLQPIPDEPNDDWTADFQTAVQWLRSGPNKRIRGRIDPHPELDL